MISSRILQRRRQKKSTTALYAIATLQMGNLERHEVLKIEDRGQCQTCLEYQRPGENFCSCGSILHCVTAEVKKQAEQRINGRFIMYVPGFHNLALKNIQRGPRYGNSLESEKRKKARAYLGSAKKQNFGTIEDTSSTKCACTNKRYTQSEWKMDLLHFFWRTGLLQRPIQGRTTLPRSRQRHHKDRRTPRINTRLYSGRGNTWPDSPQCPMLNSEHRGIHGHGPLHQGSGILRHRKHGDNPNNPPPHLMSQQLVLNTRRNTSSGRFVARRIRWCRCSFDHSSNWQSESGNPNGEGVHRYTPSRSLCQVSCSQTHMWRTPHTWALVRFEVGLKSHSIKTSDADLLYLSGTVTTCTATTWPTSLHRRRICAITRAACLAAWRYTKQTQVMSPTSLPTPKYHRGQKKAN